MIPPHSKLLALEVGKKTPRGGTHAHLDAVPQDQVDLGLVPRYANFGIALDGQFLVVDVDRPEALEGPYASLGDTWTQATRRGRHMLFTHHGGGSNKKFPGGDVKVRGYIVGPGSVVDGTEYRYLGGTPQPAPPWLVDLVTSTEAVEVTSGAFACVEVPGVPSGSHDDFLYQVGCWLRGRYGLSEEAIRSFLASGPLAVLEGSDPDRPYTSRDLARLARSAAVHDATGAVLLASTTSLRCGTEVDAVPVRLEGDVLPGFVPRAALTVLYGDGKIGKSSWASWLAARESRKGQRVVFLPSGEETFDLFVQRARRNGCDDSLLFEYRDASFNLTTGVPRLQNAIADLGGVSLVYIDALYSQFGESSGENEAVRARRNLMHLARMAEESGVAVLGTIHENAQGNLLGSREMRNVCRSLLHATGGKGKHFTIRSAGANGWSPEYGVEFPGHAEPLCNEDGEPLYVEDMFGEQIPQSVWVLSQGEKIMPYETAVNVADIEELVASKIEAYLLDFPDASNSQVALDLNIPKTTVLKEAGAIRGRLGLTARQGRPPKEPRK